MRGVAQWPLLVEGDGASSALYYCRDWWDGQHADVLLCTGGGGQAPRKRCRVDIGSADPARRERDLFDGPMPWDRFDALARIAAEVVAAGIATQERSRIMTHFDDHYGIRLPGVAPVRFSVRCGKHDHLLVATYLEALLGAAPLLARHLTRAT